MQHEAAGLGRQLVDLESELDQAFRGGAVADAEVSRLSAVIAAVEGQLRHTHLAAHLRVKDLLSAEQVARYDALRGYTDGGAEPAAGGPDHGAGHQGH